MCTANTSLSKLTVKNDYTYEGEWKADAKAGHGTLTKADGTSYEG